MKLDWTYQYFQISIIFICKHFPLHFLHGADRTVILSMGCPELSSPARKRKILICSKTKVLRTEDIINKFYLPLRKLESSSLNGAWLGREKKKCKHTSTRHVLFGFSRICFVFATKYKIVKSDCPEIGVSWK